MNRLVNAMIVLGSVFASANSNIAVASTLNGDLGRFDRQIDGVGACRAVVVAPGVPGGEPEILLVGEDGILDGVPGAPAGIQDLAVLPSGVLFSGGDLGIHRYDPQASAETSPEDGQGKGWIQLGTMPVTAVSAGGDPVRVMAVGAAATVEDGTIFAIDPASGRQLWWRPQAYPGARGVLVMPDGSAWVADTDRHRLVKLDPSGLEIAAVGDRGAFPGLFNTPVDLALHGDRIYVADRLNHRISCHRATDGAFLSQWGMHAVQPREGDGRIHYPESVSISPDGEEIVVLEPFERRYQVFGRLREGDDASGTGLPQRRGVESHFGTDIAADGDWLAMWEPEGGAVVVFNTEHGIPLHLSTFTGAGPPPAGVGRLASVAIDGERGDVWLVDAGHRRLSRWQLRPERPGELVFDPFMGRFARGWSYAAIEEALAKDRGVDRARIELVDAEVSNGRLHVLDASGPTIMVMDRSLGLQGVVPLPSEIRPSQFAVLSGDDGGWIVADPDAGEVWLIDGEGNATSKSLRPLGIQRPFGVVETANGFAVSDRSNDHVVMLDRDFNVAVKAGETGGWDGALWRPVGLVGLPGGAVAVVDQGNHRAQAFDPATGEWRMTFSLGQGHDRPILLKEDFMPEPTPSEAPGEAQSEAQEESP